MGTKCRSPGKSFALGWKAKHCVKGAQRAGQKSHRNFNQRKIRAEVHGLQPVIWGNKGEVCKQRTLKHINMCAPGSRRGFNQGLLTSSLRNFSCGTFQKFMARISRKVVHHWMCQGSNLLQDCQKWQLLPAGRVKLGSRQAMRTVEVALGSFEEEPDWHIRFQSNPFPSITVKPSGDKVFKGP